MITAQLSTEAQRFEFSVGENVQVCQNFGEAVGFLCRVSSETERVLRTARDRMVEVRNARIELGRVMIQFKAQARHGQYEEAVRRTRLSLTTIRSAVQLAMGVSLTRGELDPEEIEAIRENKIASLPPHLRALARTTNAFALSAQQLSTHNLQVLLGCRDAELLRELRGMFAAQRQILPKTENRNDLNADVRSAVGQILTETKNREDLKDAADADWEGADELGVYDGELDSDSDADVVSDLASDPASDLPPDLAGDGDDLLDDMPLGIAGAAAHASAADGFPGAAVAPVAAAPGEAGAHKAATTVVPAPRPLVSSGGAARPVAGGQLLLASVYEQIATLRQRVAEFEAVVRGGGSLTGRVEERLERMLGELAGMIAEATGRAE